MRFFCLLYLALHQNPAEPQPRPKKDGPAVASSRHSPRWLLLSGGLCAKVQRGTHVICACSPNRPDCGHPPGTRGLQRSIESLPWWRRTKASLHGVLGDHSCMITLQTSRCIWLASPRPLQHCSSAGTRSSQEDGGGGHILLLGRGRAAPSRQA